MITGGDTVRRNQARNFPGDPAVKTPGFHCSGVWVQPLVGGTNVPRCHTWYSEKNRKQRKRQQQSNKFRKWNSQQSGRKDLRTIQSSKRWCHNQMQCKVLHWILALNKPAVSLGKFELELDYISTCNWLGVIMELQLCRKILYFLKLHRVQMPPGL